MQTPVSHAVSRLVQHLRDIRGRVFSALRRGRREVGDCLLEEVGVVAATRFEDQLARRSALFTSITRSHTSCLQGSVHLRPPWLLVFGGVCDGELAVTPSAREGEEQQITPRGPRRVVQRTAAVYGESSYNAVRQGPQVSDACAGPKLRHRRPALPLPV